MKRLKTVNSILAGALPLFAVACGNPDESARIEENMAAAHIQAAPVSVQALVDAAAPGSVVHIPNGKVCGFAVHHPLDLDGRGVRLVACADSPMPVATLPDLKAGILLDEAASGTIVRGFHFEGEGVSKGVAKALAFGVFSRGASQVVVADNHFAGTVQAITDAGGPGWLITGNRIVDLEALPCPGACGGGDGIVVSHARTGTASADHVVVLRNRIGALAPPDGLPFSITGILGWSVHGLVVAENRVKLPGSPTVGVQYTRTAGGGVLIDAPCGQGQIVRNDLKHAETGLFIDAECAQGTLIFDNSGSTETATMQLAARSSVAAAGAAQPKPLGLD